MTGLTVFDQIFEKAKTAFPELFVTAPLGEILAAGLPACPGCNQSDRVEHKTFCSHRRYGVPLTDQMNPTNAEEWWCDRCNGWLCALPVLVAESADASEGK